MEITRRHFVVAAAATCAGCGAQTAPSGPPITKVIDAGPVAAYQADGVYANFRHQGFFLVRQNAELTALSSDCTHRDCPLRAMADNTFYCKCHGSQFDEMGHVTRGPAVRDLPKFPTLVDEHEHLLVQVTRLHFDEE